MVTPTYTCMHVLHPATYIQCMYVTVHEYIILVFSINMLHDVIVHRCNSGYQILILLYNCVFHALHTNCIYSNIIIT